LPGPQQSKGIDYFFLPLLLPFAFTFLMLFFIPDMHPHVLHIFASFQKYSDFASVPFYL